MFSQKCIHLWWPKIWQKVLKVDLVVFYWSFISSFEDFICWENVKSPCFVSAANSLYYPKIFHFICQQIQASNTTQEIYLIFIHRPQRIIWITWFRSFYSKVNSIHCFQKIPICHNMSPTFRLLFIHSHGIFCIEYCRHNFRAQNIFPHGQTGITDLVTTYLLHCLQRCKFILVPDNLNIPYARSIVCDASCHYVMQSIWHKYWIF